MAHQLVKRFWNYVTGILCRMKDQNLIWYASYGSNLNRDRFYLYIKGGPLPGKNRVYPGCRNKTLPSAEKNLFLNYELYFARKATVTWGGGGVGFISTVKNKDII